MRFQSIENAQKEMDRLERQKRKMEREMCSIAPHRYTQPAYWYKYDELRRKKSGVEFEIECVRRNIRELERLAEKRKGGDEC